MDWLVVAMRPLFVSAWDAMSWVARVLLFLLLIMIPMFIVVLPYCFLLAATMPPADSPGWLILTMGSLLLGAALMGGIPALAFWLYGRKLGEYLSL